MRTIIPQIKIIPQHLRLIRKFLKMGTKNYCSKLGFTLDVHRMFTPPVLTEFKMSL